jgi:glycosyltransferase involved in cell wall biosynthesis
MNIRDLRDKILFKGLYRRIILRQPKRHESVAVSSARRLAGVFWDRIFNQPFDDRERDFDLTLIVPPASKGWILDGICKEIVRYFPGRATIVYGHKNLPSSRAYFFSHYFDLKESILFTPQILRSRILVWYTHPADCGLTQADLTHWLNQIDCVVATCSHFRDSLIADGVDPGRVHVVLGGADPHFFPGHARLPNGAVGICSAFYERKDPDRILEVVRRMPHRNFILLGRRWDSYRRFGELASLPNFEYLESGYAGYPAFYGRLTVFLSASTLEGGPIPLLEAMMANVVPVASDTGFARDLIQSGKNGYIFPVDSPADSICEYIDAAYDIDSDVRQSVLPYSWKDFSLGVQSLLEKSS